MPSVCVVSNCNNKYSSSQKISYHKFPLKNQPILVKWMQFVNREDGWKPTRWSSICCDHFTINDFVKLSKTRKRLKRDAVPTVLCGTGISLEETNLNVLNSSNKDIVDHDHLKDDCDFLRNKAQNSKVTLHDQTVQIFDQSTSSVESEVFKYGSNYLIDDKIQKHKNNNTLKGDRNHEKVQAIIPHNNSCSESKDHKSINEVSYEKDCRLCGTRCRTVATFLTNFELFGIIQKCFPTLNFEQDDYMSKDICSTCLRRLTKFSSFVDDVIKSQKALQEKYQYEKSTKISLNPERNLKIKQEPIVNVKQEIADVNQNLLNLDISLEDDDELDQKLNLYGLPNLNAQDIIDNCDIMEIINLDDGFINIPDDEIIVDDKKDNPKLLEDFELYMRNHCIENINRSILEHSYCSILLDNDNIQRYKTENNEDDDYKMPNILTNDVITVPEKNTFTNFCNKNETSIQHESSNHPNTILSSFAVQRLISKSPPNQLSMHGAKSTTSKISSESSKPNIVVLNESIVKSAEAFGFHSCYFCQFQFLYKAELDNHLRENHSNPKLIPSATSSPTEQIAYPKDEPQIFHEQVGNIQQQQINSKKTKDHLNSIILSSAPSSAMYAIQMSSLPLESDSIQNEFPNSWKTSEHHEMNPLPVMYNSEISTLTFPVNPTNLNDSNKLKPNSFPVIKDLQSNANLENVSLVKDSNTLVTILNSSPNTYHIQLNNNETNLTNVSKDFNCALCSLQFRNFNDYFKHKLKVHPKPKCKIKKTKIVCNTCHKVFSSQLALSNHVNYICDYKNSKHLMFGCGHCNTIFNHWRLLKHHHLTCNNIKFSKTIESIQYNAKIFSCNYCDKSYIRYKYFKKHELSHDTPIPIEFKAKTFVCKMCTKIFDNSNDLETHHTQNECTKSTKVISNCNICEKQFKNKILLKAHVMGHRKSKCAKCAKCGKEFSRYKNLLQHLVTHIDERKFKCNLCHKIFKRRGGLQQHIKGTHLQLKPHICSVCQHRYALKADMMKCRHSDLNTQCNFVFYTKS